MRSKSWRHSLEELKSGLQLEKSLIEIFLKMKGKAHALSSTRYSNVEVR